jgi:hypothetical protein
MLQRAGEEAEDASERALAWSWQGHGRSVLGATPGWVFNRDVAR